MRRCIHIIAAAPSSTCNMQHACCKMTRLILLMLLHAAVCRFACLFVCLSVSVYLLRFMSLLVLTVVVVLSPAAVAAVSGCAQSL